MAQRYKINMLHIQELLAHVFLGLQAKMTCKLRLNQPPLIRTLLQVPHLCVFLVFGQQLGVGAALDDAAFFHHQNLVRINYGRQAVGNHLGGFILSGCTQFGLYGAFVG